MNKETLITILNRRKKGGSGKQDVVRPSTRSRYLARRLSGGISFFDCAMGADDTESPFGLVDTINVPGTSAIWDYTPPVLTDYDARNTTLFGSGLTPTASNFKELKKDAANLDNYLLAIYSDDGNYAVSQANSLNDYKNGSWSIPSSILNSANLRISATEADDSFGGPWFDSLYIRGDHVSRRKITTSPSYSAPSVEFTFGGGCKVYFMPRTIFQDLFSVAYGGSSPSATYVQYRVGLPAYVWWGRSLLTIATSFVAPTSSNPISQAAWDARYPNYLARVNQLDGTGIGRCAELTTHDGGDTQTLSYAATSTLLNATDWPPPPGLPVHPFQAGQWQSIGGSYSFADSSLYPEGILIGIIVKGTQPYYFWHTGDLTG